MRAAVFFYAVILALLLVLSAAAALSMGQQPPDVPQAAQMTKAAVDTQQAVSRAETEEMTVAEPEPEAEAEVYSLAGDGTVSVLLGGEVYEMPLEDFVFGATLCEVPASYPADALRAVAVAVRTFAVHKLAAGGYCEAHGGALLCGNAAHCMAYTTESLLADRYGAETAAASAAAIRAAVEDTRGEVLCYDGEICQIFFFAMAAGRTTACADVFGGALPYLVSVASPEDETVSGYETTVSLTRAEAGTLLRDAGYAVSDGDDITVCYDDAGYVNLFSFGDASLSGTAARFLFGLRSACFTVSEADGVLTFTVNGYGHGVGLSQTGASLYAARGWEYRDILQHYFPGTTLAALAFSG